MQVDTPLSGPGLRLHLVELFAKENDLHAVIAMAREAEAFILGSAASARIPEISAEALAAGILAESERAAKLEAEISGPFADNDPPPTAEEPPHRTRVSWTPALVDQLERLIAAGLSYKTVAEKLGIDVDPGAVAAQVSLRKLNKKYPRSRRGALLFEPYPLDAPWPRPASSPIVIVAPADRKKQGMDTFNSRVKALAAGAASGWDTDINVDEFKAHLNAGETFVDLAERYRAPSWQSVRAFALAHNLLSKSASGSWVRPGNLAAVSGPTGQERMRKCLRCGSEFLSEGPGNRICPDCKPAVNAAYEPVSAKVGP
ncbi:hypothetical protein KL86APRO_20384 [uncultured Alphaproteobacteria bacterium]|uniref:Uncharacterized protein n=1 Tax=uncultured Alphaproteobacteria bacterium TaxID=91750 RepID=A0A212KK03_9PROT|nr:hypothetical protein KL86APRO_20384 [uncultured Alphaproteobacteria bacterium]